MRSESPFVMLKIPPLLFLKSSSFPLISLCLNRSSDSFESQVTCISFLLDEMISTLMAVDTSNSLGAVFSLMTSCAKRSVIEAANTMISSPRNNDFFVLIINSFNLCVC